jgi:hypothetical protein
MSGQSFADSAEYCEPFTPNTAPWWYYPCQPSTLSVWCVAVTNAIDSRQEQAGLVRLRQVPRYLPTSRTQCASMQNTEVPRYLVRTKRDTVRRLPLELLTSLIGCTNKATN